MRGLITFTVAVCLAAQAVSASTGSAMIAVPSGQNIAFIDALQDRTGQGLTQRFRFLAPDLPQMLQSQSYQTLEADLAHLCEVYALPRLGMPQPKMIVISLHERAVEFGASAPDVAQVFEAYRPNDTICEWEAF
ncbi:hypothetical protein EDD53_1188 [Pacificibacter maritimus]|uniref:Acetolactate synthase n=1 Tax=Pacificibacter maritimus TaxID=762213 RepID=A0A3N4UWX8_9RHOB|nr:DUF6497 family protein [Pacificibacter maritimus]RPE72049.1 hypothetical protein EDD53_1188 [Pacificibacter maritimus]